MKPQEAKDRFIVLRAEGKSYNTISKELCISKSTCTDWERRFQAEIADRKTEQLENLYSSYFMTKEARITKLGETLKEIDTALEKTDFSEMAPERLLDFKLKYTQALKEEYIPLEQKNNAPEEISPAALMALLADLLGRVQRGETAPEQASRESAILANLLKAYEQTELERKIDALEAVVEGRV